MPQHTEAVRSGALGVAVLVTIALASPADARACGATPPSWTLLTSEAGEIPAGTTELKVYHSALTADPTQLSIKLSAGEGASATELPVTLRVAAPWMFVLELGATAIEAGATYTLEVAEGAEYGLAPSFTFRGSEALSVPAALGSLSLSEPERGQIALGGCGDSYDGVQAAISLLPSPEAELWSRAASHQLLVNGAPAFAPELPLVDYLANLEPLTVRAMVPCGPQLGAPGGLVLDGIDLTLEPGRHTFAWQTTFPDGTVLTTDSQQLELTCESASAAPDAGNDETPSDADAGQGAEDAAHDAKSSREHASICAATGARGARSGAALAWLVAVSLFVTARRRSRV